MVKPLAVSLIAGLIFGMGLTVSGMINPARVIGFLDVAGRWDPTLAFVMAGALAVATPAFALALRRGAQPQLGGKFQIPTRNDIDRRLIAGGAIFGIGWGLSGICPGPAIAALGSLIPSIVGFAAAMIAGMIGFRFWAARRD